MTASSHRPFVAIVSAVGLALLFVFAITGGAGVVDDADGLMLLLAAAILVAELFPVEIPDGDGEVSFSTTFAFALLLTDGGDDRDEGAVGRRGHVVRDLTTSSARRASGHARSDGSRSSFPPPRVSWC